MSLLAVVFLSQNRCVFILYVFPDVAQTPLFKLHPLTLVEIILREI